MNPDLPRCPLCGGPSVPVTVSPDDGLAYVACASGCYAAWPSEEPPAAEPPSDRGAFLRLTGCLG